MTEFQEKHSPDNPSAQDPAVAGFLQAKLSSRSTLIAVSLVFFSLWVLSLDRIYDFDYWTHLYYGKKFLTQWTPADFIQAFFGNRSKQWPFQIALYQVYSWHGHELVALFVAVIFSAATWLFLLPVREEHWGKFLLRLLLVLLTYKVFLNRLSPRPELFGYLLFALALVVISLWLERPRNVWLVLLGGLLLCWYSSHQTVYLGAPFLLAALLINVRRQNLRDLWPPRSAKSILIVAAVITCAALSAWFALYVYKRLAAGGFLSGISEMRPTWEYPQVLKEYLLLAAATVVVCWRSTSRRWRLLFLLAPVVLVGLIVVRNVALAALAMLFLNLQALQEWKWPALFARRQALTSMALLLLSFALTGWVVKGRLPTWGTGLEPGTAPVEAARFVLERNLEGSVFNNLDSGGYLLWAWQGAKVQHFLDGRLTSVEKINDHDLLLEGQKFQDLLAKHRFHTMLLQPAYWNNARLFPLVTRLMLDPQWSLVHASDALVFVNPLPAGLVALPKQEGWQAMLGMLDHYEKISYTAEHLDFSRGLALQGLGRFAEAQAAFAKGLKRHPELAGYYRKVMGFQRR